MQRTTATAVRSAAPVIEAGNATRRRRGSRVSGAPAPVTKLPERGSAARQLALPRADRPPRPAVLPTGLIGRPQLVRRLLEDREATLVVLAAPPGYGKTSLLAEWAEHDDRPVAWVTLGSDDNAPAHLLSSIAISVGSLAVTRRVRVAPAPGDHEKLLGSDLEDLVLEVSDATGGIVLVVDDLHVLDSAESLEVLDRLARVIPRGSKLALASRATPAISLGRLRSQHALLPLGPRELAMSPGEARQLLAAAGLDLDTTGVERLLLKTEGWPAGLYLAAISLRGEGDSEALDGFCGEDHVVSEYVREELLATLSPESLALLTCTSILDELSGELCDAVLERRGSGLLLRELADTHLLVTALDRGERWYRCRSLLRDVLLSELHRAQPERMADLHRRAAAWFGERDETDQALRHAVAAGDMDQAGALLWKRTPGCVTPGCNERIRRWLDTFTDEQLASSAMLALSAAYSHLAMGDLRMAEHWCDAAEHVPGLAHEQAGRPAAAGLALVRAALAVEGVERAGDDARRAYELEGVAGPWRAACCLVIGVAEHLTGDRAQARERFHEGARRSGVGAPSIEALCLAELAIIAAEEGDWEAALDLRGRAIGQLERHRLKREPTSALVLAASAWIWAHRGRADQAKSDLHQATQLLDRLEDFVPWYEVETRVLLARAAIGLADVTRARALLTSASKQARRVPDVPVFRSWFDDAWGQIDSVSAAALSGPSSLTMAELRILRFLPSHLSFREIGGRLHVSTNTVKSQAHAVYRKLDAGSRSEAVERASDLGLIDSALS